MKSFFDQDFYTFTVGQAILEKFPKACVTYEFTSRKSVTVNIAYVKALQNKINNMISVRITEEEIQWMRQNCPYIKTGYLEYLRSYCFDSSEVFLNYPQKPEFDLQEVRITIKGSWHRTVFWEVVLLALISETYYELIDTEWSNDWVNEQTTKICNKATFLKDHKCMFADFGTRRRRHFDVQDLVVKNISEYKNCFGTSNVHLAMKYGVKPIGTQSHQWIMGISGLESLRYANRFAMQRWNEVYQGDLGIVLPDTFGVSAFFEDFDGQFARLFDGVRHDSGDPFEFANKVVDHYKKIRINCMSKYIVFSDSLDVELAARLKKHCDQLGIMCSFGIGTNFTNCFDSPALNIVIKLRSIRKNIDSQEVQVVKISDVSTKATGDIDALRVARYTFTGEALDYEQA